MSKTIITMKTIPMKKTYAYHRPSVDGLRRVSELRQLYSAIHEAIERIAPDSRQRSVALTNLETSAMWAVKAVVMNDPNAEVDLELDLDKLKIHGTTPAPTDEPSAEEKKSGESK